MVRHPLSLIATSASLMLAWSTATQANTLAHWRFEAGPAGAQLDHLDPNFGYPNFSADVPDSSGNGNALSVWDEGGAGFAYRSDVPAPTLANGDANNFSIKNTGGGPAAYTGPGVMRTIEPSAFTVEASFKLENGGFRTLVGRDSRATNVAGAAPNGDLAGLYLQATPNNNVAIKFIDKAGYFHVAETTVGDVIQTFDFPSDNDGTTAHWYHMAGVSDGSTLSLYLADATAGIDYQLVAQTDLTLSGSPDTALANGSTGDADGGGEGTSPDGNDWAAGDWSVGRGLYAGGHVDRGYGFIDEVRISDMALAPSEFLFLPIPEPSSMVLVLGAAALLAVARKR
jgi:hypothetical protein